MHGPARHDPHGPAEAAEDLYRRGTFRSIDDRGYDAFTSEVLVHRRYQRSGKARFAIDE
jgi:hypothetical protein